VAGVVLAVPGLAGCVLSASDGPVPPQPPPLEIDLEDHAFAFDDPVPAGRLVVEASNVGDEPHEVVLAPLPEDFDGDIDDFVDADERRLISPIYELAPQEPGETGRFAVNLDPGRYALLCFVTDEEGTPHYEKGMAADLTVN
jgi:hypothetical protein